MATLSTRTPNIPTLDTYEFHLPDGSQLYSIAAETREEARDEVRRMEHAKGQEVVFILTDNPRVTVVDLSPLDRPQVPLLGS